MIRRIYLIIFVTLLTISCVKQKKTEMSFIDSLKSNMKNGTYFYENYKSNNISYELFSNNSSSLNELYVFISNENNKYKDKVEIDGIISKAEIADLDNDNKAELMVYYNSVGSGSYGGILSYSFIKNDRIIKIEFPEISKNIDIKNGYMGHDKFSLVDNQLIQEFPIYRVNDSNSKATGGKRIVYYNVVEIDGSKSFKYLKHKDLKE